MKRFLIILVATVFMMVALIACGEKDTKTSGTDRTDGKKLNVVTTLYPYYDFVKQIAKDKVNVTMIVPTGMDTHSFEPTPQDMVTIQKADVFIYNGGGMESWVPDVIKAAKNKNQVADCMMDQVKTVEEETVEGMEPEEEEEGEEEEGVEYDEHVWTSPKNAKLIAAEIGKVLEKNDKKNAAFYKKNTEKYLEKLTKLDEEFREVVDHADLKYLVFGDKFPLRYFVEEYGLKYSAAFNGCSTETEPSSDTIAYLIDKVKKEKVPVVYHIELSNEKIADTICEATGAKKMLFHTCHNVTQKDFDKGVTYIELMEQNVKNLKAGLTR